MEESSEVARAQSEFGGNLDLWVQKCRQDLLAGIADGPASEVLSAYFQGGKMLRARLIFSATCAVGGTFEAAAAAAEAIELLHGASLVHDDIIDDATERRGIPALHTQIGMEQALTIGDYLLLRSFSVLLRGRTMNALERTIEALQAFSDEGQKCCSGQLAELEGRVTSEVAYLAMVRGKTGSLFALAATTGGRFGGGSAKEIEALRVFGEQLGTAFQISDDVLELVTEPRKLGKSSRRSLARGLPLYPVICFLACASEQAKADYNNLNPSSDNRAALVSILNRAGIFEMLINRQDSHVGAAHSALEVLQPSLAVDSLSALVEDCREMLTSELRRVRSGLAYEDQQAYSLS